MKPRILGREFIDPDPTQPRQNMDREELQRLADSIRFRGLLQPLIVYEQSGRFVVVDGHRRLEATGIAGLSEVLALVLDAKPDAETLLLTQLAANSLRVDLKPSEKAVAYKRLVDSRGWTLTQLADNLNVSKSSVTQLMSLLSLPESARSMVDAGSLACSTAYAISRETDESRKAELLRRATQGTLRRDDAARLVSQKPTPRFRSSFRIGESEIHIVTSDEIEVTECLELVQQLAGEFRRAAKQGLNVKTLERVLADRAANES